MTDTVTSVFREVWTWMHEGLEGSQSGYAREVRPKQSKGNNTL